MFWVRDEKGHSVRKGNGSWGGLLFQEGESSREKSMAANQGTRALNYAWGLVRGV